MKILLLNPPWKTFILRDGHCGTTSKGAYNWAPIDLLVLSGILSQDHDLEVLDANALKLSENETQKGIFLSNADLIIFLTSAISFYEDVRFLKAIHQKLNCQLLASGDLPFFDPKFVMNYFSELNGIITNFTSSGILRYLAGERIPLEGLIYRNSDVLIFPPSNIANIFHYPTPRHELFPLQKYPLPFGKILFRKTTSVITTWGCPYNCSFCQFGNINFITRNLDDFIHELTYIKSLDVKMVFIRDYTFGPNLIRGKEICRKIIQSKLDLAWICEARTDCVDNELLSLMKEAGCVCVMFGVESGDEKILAESQKSTSHSKTLSIFKYCREINLPTLGHFILGLPGENAASLQSTIDLSIKLGCDYASFNFFVPRVGTAIRNKMIDDKMIRVDDFDHLDSSTPHSFEPALDIKTLKHFHRKAIVQFYFRPLHLIRLIKITNWKILLSNGFQTIYSILKR